MYLLQNAIKNIIPDALYSPNKLSQDKIYYMIPYRQQNLIPQAIKELLLNFPEYSFDIAMNTLEEAYLNLY